MNYSGAGRVAYGSEAALVLLRLERCFVCFALLMGIARFFIHIHNMQNLS